MIKIKPYKLPVGIIYSDFDSDPHNIDTLLSSSQGRTFALYDDDNMVALFGSFCFPRFAGFCWLLPHKTKFKACKRFLSVIKQVNKFLDSAVMFYDEGIIRTYAPNKESEKWLSLLGFKVNANDANFWERKISWEAT